VRSFLSYRAIRGNPQEYRSDATELSDTGLDLQTSNTTTSVHVAGITVPLLITASTADTQVHLPSAELLFNSATRTHDKELIFVEGAEHDMTAASLDADDIRGVHVRSVGEWLAERFLS
jgi:esterase/lipase